MIDIKALAKGLVDMKRPKKTEKQMKDSCMPCGVSEEAYPWGMRLTFEKDELKKLGIKTTGRKVGEKVTVVAEAEIVEISATQNMRGEDRNRMELQLKKLKVI